MKEEIVKLTQYSHGAGCGCKIAPQVLEKILLGTQLQKSFPSLLVGSHLKDDAAVYKLNEQEALIATTDFFTPIVDDAYTFGQVAAANAISDVYAMGGTPIMSLAILGWPINTLPVEEAQRVLEGARNICDLANIPLAGGHSIDSPEPIFGLSVNGRILLKNLKQNKGAQEGDLLLITKPLGVGILSTAAKRNQIEQEDLKRFENQLIQLNKIGEQLGEFEAVHAMTDVTGFGLAGHLIEMTEAADLSAELQYHAIPKIEGLEKYLAKNILPDATYRNWNAVSDQLKFEPSADALEGFKLLPDPQTNGGLLIAVQPDGLPEIQTLFRQNGLGDFVEPIGKITALKEKRIYVV